jgi:hypothetical protein
MKNKYIKQFKMFVPDDDGSALDWFKNVMEEEYDRGAMEATEVCNEVMSEIKRCDCQYVKEPKEFKEGEHFVGCGELKKRMV